MKIHVGQFSCKLPGKKVSIASSIPKGVHMQTVRDLFPMLAAFIVPSWGLIKSLKDNKLSWAAYSRIYQENLSKVNLRQALKKLCDLVKHDEIILCCWEGADDEYCHRKILYDLLPEDIRGVRE